MPIFRRGRPPNAGFLRFRPSPAEALTSRRAIKATAGVGRLTLPLSRGAFARPEIPAFDIDDVAAILALHLGVRADPADARPGLVAAARAFDVDFEMVGLFVRHRSSEAGSLALA